MSIGLVRLSLDIDNDPKLAVGQLAVKKNFVHISVNDKQIWKLWHMIGKLKTDVFIFQFAYEQLQLKKKYLWIVDKRCSKVGKITMVETIQNKP